MALSLLALFLLLIISQVHVLGQQPGFLSIDCGLDANYSGYTDPSSGIFYVSDEPYVDTGENHMVAAEYQGSRSRYFQTVRSFPSGLRNCYALPTKAGDKYLARVEISYGNYDGKNSSSSVQFDLHLGAYYWETATPDHTYEALFVAWAAWTPVCLVNTGRGTPFVSAMDLRPMAALYPPVSPALFMSAYSRQSLGQNVLFTRYPDDTYDRFWLPMVRINPRWVNLSTTGPIQPDPNFMQPLTVLRKAVTAASNETTLTITWQENKKAYSFMAFLHFADFQNTQPRQFDIYFNGEQLGASDKPHNPAFMAASCVYSSSMYRATDGSYNITIASTAMSVLPPMLNALEIYTVIPNDSPITFPKDFSTYDSTTDSRLVNVPGHTIVSHEDQLQNTENRRFTYKELEKFTNNFKRFIGKGGFGLVYYGCLGDGTEVAVKMRSESSTHGLDEFLAEVQSLTRVHHRNLVSLVGYCWEGDHLALVYEYMPKGTLYDHLRGKHGLAEPLNWKTRVQIVLEAAQGLDYLHKGCNLPIIHRDVKSSNILLGQNLKAKIADFGLSKTYITDTQTHISATAAGTPGYIDPEYFLTGRLTESSDVYSFGIVLLEVATGEPPMVPGNGHIVKRVKQMIATGDINLIADARLRDAYDVSSMWKVLDIAMMCTVDSVAQRPTMAAVVSQLRESLALEEAREDNIICASQGSNVEAMSPAFGPLAIR
ncbi:hypothetical protein QOZ80_6AG0533020 [Eleusine coracana subsp. coracana]|nr:hypothetical protein QOZ80_6AG0533020 [Eleusine coracana subsp. coracana]